MGRKHSIATVLAVHILATLSNMRGPVAAAEYARSLDQEELQSIGAWYNRTTGCYEPPSKATINRVVMHADAQQVEATLQRYARPRVALADQDTERTALAADGKHIRGANRNGTMHFETATLVEHSTGVPVASLNYHDDGGEIAAVCALLEEVPIGGAVITIDALHTTLDTAAKIVEKHGADYLMTVKQNASETYEALLTMPWELATGRFSEDPEKGHGRIDRRHIEVLTPPPNTLTYPHVAQVFRVRRERTILKTGEKSVEYAYGITSVAAKCGSAKQLLAWRGHWSIEVKNHLRRDKTFDEDACLARTGLAPANRATCNNIALAVILHQGNTNAAAAMRHFMLHRKAAFAALLSPELSRSPLRPPTNPVRTPEHPDPKAGRKLLRCALLPLRWRARPDASASTTMPPHDHSPAPTAHPGSVKSLRLPVPPHPGQSLRASTPQA